MPALDQCHPQVVRVLEKAGWTISPIPFILRLGKHHRIYIDIEATHTPSAHIMVVEIKCFQKAAAETDDLYSAIGQYLIYQSLLENQSVVSSLYLAVPDHAYAGVFRRMAMPFLAANRVKLIIVNVAREVITQWVE